MGAAFAVRGPAVEVRERVVEFVEGVAGPLPLRRQRENALLYVRGLVEQGGRKSLQPTLLRLEETPARYESVQQFLADSPWQPQLLVRACAICPGFVDTPMAAWTGMASQEMIQPEVCAGVVGMLLSLSPRARVPQVVIERLGS